MSISRCLPGPLTRDTRNSGVHLHEKGFLAKSVLPYGAGPCHRVSTMTQPGRGQTGPWRPRPHEASVGCQLPQLCSDSERQAPGQRVSRPPSYVTQIAFQRHHRSKSLTLRLLLPCQGPSDQASSRHSVNDRAFRDLLSNTVARGMRGFGCPRHTSPSVIRPVGWTVTVP